MLKKKFMFNAIIRLILESYIELTICAAINIYSISYNNQA
jgi:hypothetical protein